MTNTTHSELGAPTPQASPLVHGPIFGTLIGLSAPNLVALCSSAIITIAETAYVGRLGVSALAGVTLVFPIVMLMQMMSAGAMGGTISGAISRALGAGDNERAQAIAFNAALIGVAAGIVFAALLWAFGPIIYRALGGRGAALDQAILYSNITALAIIGIWLANTFASIARGTGLMAPPAFILLAGGLVQISVGGALAFGLGPLPALGVAGVALGQVVAFSLTAIAMLGLTRSQRARVKLALSPTMFRPAIIADVLRPGLLACLSPIQSVATVLVLTALVAQFGADALAGYGVGARLEFLLIPIAFAIGVGSVPMVGAAIGAGNVKRARHVAWTAGALAAGALAIVGAIVAIAPDLWATIFVDEPGVLSVTRDYLRIASVGYPFFGLALCLYFAAQGAGKVGGPILAQSLRLALIVIGGWLIMANSMPLWGVFALSALAMVAQGLFTLVAVRATRWGASERRVL
ncbi:MATE family efflux transporter [Vitreimonas flagellata]|uniref:MATE family efflux transporter n=1 Tax=Vitreimonas flagellata TaxID=2560861 RepID=UPI001075562F|nr:MATE family efflux transporter [Vitreimonas flagellata]